MTSRSRTGAGGWGAALVTFAMLAALIAAALVVVRSAPLYRMAGDLEAAGGAWLQRLAPAPPLPRPERQVQPSSPSSSSASPDQAR